jgi:hypothetical protein
MIDSSKSPERLDKDNLINVAVVLSNIKEAAKDKMDCEEVVDVPVEFKSNHIGTMKVPLDMLINAEKSKVQVMEYLKTQGVLQQSTFSMQPRDYDFLVSFQPDNFQAYYNRVVALTFPYLEELIRLSNQSPRSTRTQVPSDSSSPTPLPEVVFRLGKDFAVHKGNVISYKNSEIPLERQPAKIVAKIMERSHNSEYTPVDYLAATVLPNDTDYKQPEKYVSKMVSEARTTFKKYINTNHNYFPSKRGIGYLFKY